MNPQMRSAFDEDLLELRELVLRMGARVDRAIERAMTSLQENDAELAQQVVDDDDVINELRFTIEENALLIIARQQPTATDLRVVVAAMNIVLDLERMGDHAAGIAKTVLRHSGEDRFLEPPAGLRRMYDLTRSMLREALLVYEHSDPERAKQLALRDDEIDQQYRQLFRELLGVMAEQPEQTERALYLLFSGHNLERIADRVTNVAERVVFTNSGEMEELNVDLEDSDPS